jgi:plasmid stabilization system protein ParE
MKVILTPDALADLDHIAEHIEKDNPARAIRPLCIIRTRIHGSGLMSSGMRPLASRSR